MKKLLGVLAVTLLLVLTMTSSFADDGVQPGCTGEGFLGGGHWGVDREHRNCDPNNENFIDENQDGICDFLGEEGHQRFIDEDNDGICDVSGNPVGSKSSEQRHGHGMRGHGRNK